MCPRLLGLATFADGGVPCGSRNHHLRGSTGKSGEMRLYPTLVFIALTFIRMFLNDISSHCFQLCGKSRPSVGHGSAYRYYRHKGTLKGWRPVGPLLGI